MMALQQLGNERTTAYADGLEFVMERVFDAPRDLVWTVITDPDRVTRWWGPHGYTTTVEAMDVRIGGRWRYVAHTTGGEDVPFKGEYLEVDAPERLVYTFIVDIPGIDDKAGVITMTLEEVDGGTKLTERSVFATAEDLATQVEVGMVRGALETYDRLADEIARG